MSFGPIIEKMLKLWRDKTPQTDVLVLDQTPTGREEQDMLFGSGLSSPEELNPRIQAASRIQDMGERLLFSDRAFLITLVWAGVICVVPFFQMFFSIWGKGLSDAQFVAVVTTTTASVFGFWYLVGRYLFPKGRDD